MALSRVEVSRDVLQTCMAHALTTEREEVMGLLLGDIETEGEAQLVARVWRLSFQKRVDRRPDRVEISPEQLAAASEEAAKWSEVTRRVTRVIGWYHSHPHITVLPSHVDVQTQGQYQLLDTGFIGLIFSVYSDLPDCTSRMQLVAFQATASGSSNFQQQLVPVTVVETPPEGDRAYLKLLDLQRVQMEEEREAYTEALSAIQQHSSAAAVPSAAGLGPLAAEAADLGAAARVELGVAFHSSVYQKSLCGVLGNSLPPIAQTLVDAKQDLARTIEALEAELRQHEDHDILTRLEARTVAA